VTARLRFFTLLVFYRFPTFFALRESLELRLFSCTAGLSAVGNRLARVSKRLSPKFIRNKIMSDQGTTFEEVT